MSKLFHRQAQRIWITLFLFTGWVFGAGASVEREWDWGFLASRSRDLEGVMRTRVLGP